MTDRPDILTRGRVIWLLIENCLEQGYPLAEILPFAARAADAILGAVKIDENYADPIPVPSSAGPDEAGGAATKGVATPPAEFRGADCIAVKR